MTLFRWNLFLSGLLTFLLAGVFALQRDPAARNLELMPDMQYSPAYDAYRRNPHWENGRTLQVQPPGTIARGDSPWHYAATPADAVRAGEELTSPLDADDAGVIAQGREIYQIFCAMCHGGQGLGDGPVTRRGYPPPPPLTTGKSVNMPDGQLFHILTDGQGGMAPYASQLAPDERWQAIAYVRTLQAGAASGAAATGEVGDESVETGNTEPGSEAGDSPAVGEPEGVPQ